MIFKETLNTNEMNLKKFKLSTIYAILAIRVHFSISHLQIISNFSSLVHVFKSFSFLAI